MLKRLDTLSIDSQGLHKEWCWASVTAGVAQFFEKMPYTMENIVQSIVPSCSGNGDPACEFPYPLADALSAKKHLDYAVPGILTFDDIQRALIDRGIPVAIGITYTDLGAVLHYCLIAACSVDGANELLLLNPALPNPCEYSISYDDLIQGAVLRAIWTDSFYVK